MPVTVPARQALLVEDYTPLRTLISEALSSAGFDVRACGSSMEALSEYYAGDADVLVTDIDLPERPNGVELATILRAEDPGLAVVFITNYAAEAAFAGTVSPPEPYAFLQKSYLDSSARLIEVVESALTEASCPAQFTDEADLFGRLTPIQMDVLRMMAAGLTNAEIASRRGTNQRAVERMIYRLFASLGIANDPARNPRVIATNLYTQTFGYPKLEGGS